MGCAYYMAGYSGKGNMLLKGSKIAADKYNVGICVSQLQAVLHQIAFLRTVLHWEKWNTQM
jgi:hypothetical protein